MNMKRKSLKKTVTAAVLAAVMLIAPAGAAVSADAVAVTEETALSEAWNQISSVLKTVYAAGIKGSYVDLSSLELPAYRLSINPAALRLLNFASESLIRTDLSWISELGVDFVPTFQTKTRPYSNGYYSLISRMETEEMIPGFSAVLHINGKEIVTSDLYVDDRMQGLFVSLPELVSGEQFVSLYNFYRSAFRNLQYSPFGNIQPSAGLGSFLRAPRDMDRLLPDEELMEIILDSAGGISEYYKPAASEEKTVTALAASEKVTSYTGSITLRDGLSLLLKLMERAKEDEDFRNRLIAYIDDAYSAFMTNPYVQTMIMQAGLYKFFGMSLYNIGEQTQIQASILTGSWKFRREELNDRSESMIEEPAYYNEDTESGEEDAYHPEEQGDL